MDIGLLPVNSGLVLTPYTRVRGRGYSHRGGWAVW